MQRRYSFAPAHCRKLEAVGAAQYENKGVVYCASCDGPLFRWTGCCRCRRRQCRFRDGGSASGLLQERHAHQSRRFFPCRSRYHREAFLNPKLTIIKDAIIKEIKGGKFVSSIVYTKDGQDIELPDASSSRSVLFRIPTLKGTLEINSYGQIVVDPRMQMSKTEGIWAAGDCTDGLYHQNNIAAGEGVKALEDIYMHLHTK